MEHDACLKDVIDLSLALDEDRDLQDAKPSLKDPKGTCKINVRFR
jgi:hypothetical protein